VGRPKERPVVIINFACHLCFGKGMRAVMNVNFKANLKIIQKENGAYVYLSKLSTLGEFLYLVFE